MRKVPFATGEYYHIFNRGVDKRIIFHGVADARRFLQCMVEFNIEGPTGGIYVNSFPKNRENRKEELSNPTTKLVELVAYCLNPNHFHFLVTPLIEGGVEQFMHKLSAGYARYFNEKHERSGALFQGRYKSIHVNTNTYLLYLSAYVNLNYRVHGLSNPITKYASSWPQYGAHKHRKGLRGLDLDLIPMCEKAVILDQFDSVAEYETFAFEALREMVYNKKKAWEDMCLE